MSGDTKALKMDDFKILARSIGWPGTWGKGDTIEEALKNAGKPKHYEIFLVTADAFCDSMGGLCFNPDHPPKRIHLVQPKKVSPKKRT